MRGGSADDVIVKIAASYYSDDALRMVTACHLKRKTAGGLQHGVGVYVSFQALAFPRPHTDRLF